MANKQLKPGESGSITPTSTFPLYVIPSLFGGEAPSNLMQVLQRYFDRADRCDYGEYNAVLQIDYEPSGAAIEFQATPETIRKNLSGLDLELYAAGYYLQPVDVEREGGDRPAYDGDGYVVRAIPDRESIPDGHVFCSSCEQVAPVKHFDDYHDCIVVCANCRDRLADAREFCEDCSRLVRAGLAYGIEQTFCHPWDGPRTWQVWFCEGCAETLIICRRCVREYITAPQPQDCGWAEIDRGLDKGLCPDCVEQMERFREELEQSERLRKKLERRNR
jgi:hypothetical protein